MTQEYNYPQNFLWGASTSAYQVEGASSEDGKGKSVQDVKKIPANTSDFSVCVDFYHHFAEDIDMFAEMGLKAYRFSIAWTRILPNGRGKINQKGIDFYHRVIDKCISVNIVPIITMYHFDMPYELEKIGGWSNRESIDAFEEFAKILFTEYGNKVPYFLTINEQNVIILAGRMIGTNLEDTTNWKNLYQQNHHMMVAQAKATILGHKLAPKAKIGPAPNISSTYPKTSNPDDYFAAMEASVIRNWLYLDLAVRGEYHFMAWNYLVRNGYEPSIAEGDMEILKSSKPDFISLNYYSTGTVEALDKDVKEEEESQADQQSGLNDISNFKSVKNKYLGVTQFGWEIDPKGFKITLHEVFDRYHLPILISENGIGSYDKLEEDGTIHDIGRIEYYKAHLSQLALAIAGGVEVIGYCPWAAIDLISTHQGFRKRYGFIYVNRTDEDLLDLKRIRKDSFFWYKKLIENNGRF